MMVSFRFSPNVGSSFRATATLVSGASAIRVSSPETKYQRWEIFRVMLTLKLLGPAAGVSGSLTVTVA